MAWWKWLTRPEIQSARKVSGYYNRKKLDRIFRETERRYPFLKNFLDSKRKEILERGLSFSDTKNFLKVARGLEIARWYDILKGDAKDPQEAIRRGTGLLGQTQQNIQRTISSIRIEATPEFKQTLRAYSRAANLGMSEVLVKRASNMMMIVASNLPKDALFKSTVQQAAKASRAMYKTPSTSAAKYKIKKTFGHLLLEWAHDVRWRGQGGRKLGMPSYAAKRLLPKPTPKVVNNDFNESAKRFKGITIGKATAWYRGALAGTARKLIRSAKGKILLGASSPVLNKADDHWKGYQNRKYVAKNAEKLGFAYMSGKRYSPSIFISIKGRLAPKVFPAMFRRAMAQDIEDMAEHIERKRLSRVR